MFVFCLFCYVDRCVLVSFLAVHVFSSCLCCEVDIVLLGLLVCWRCFVCFAVLTLLCFVWFVLLCYVLCLFW